MLSGIVSEKTGHQVSVGKVSLHPFRALVVREVSILERRGDTLAFLDKAALNIDERQLFKSPGIKIHRITLEGGKLNVRKMSSDETNLSRFISRLSGDKGEEKGPSQPISFPGGITIERLIVKDVAFSYSDPFGEGAKDWFIDDIDLRGENIAWNGGLEASMQLKYLNVKERDGMALSTGFSNLKATGEGTVIENLRIWDGLSEIAIRSANLRYDSLGVFKSAPGSGITFSLEMDESTVDAASLHPFVPAAKDITAKASLSGAVHGTLESFDIENLRIQSENRVSQARISATVRNLNEIEAISGNVSIDEVRTTPGDLRKILSGISPELDPGILRNLPPDEVFRLKAAFDGSLEEFSGKAALTSERLGNITADLGGSMADGRQFVEGHIEGESIDAGALLGSNAIGGLTFSSDITADLSGKGRIRVNDLTVESFEYNGREFGRIRAEADISEMNTINFVLSSDDPKLDMEADGAIDLDGKNGDRILADIDLHHVDLHALGIDGREGSGISGRIDADILMRGSVITGQFNALAMEGRLGGERHRFGDLRLTSVENGDDVTIRLDSDLLGMQYDGAPEIAGAADDIKRMVSECIPNLFGGEAVETAQASAQAAQKTQAAQKAGQGLQKRAQKGGQKSAQMAEAGSVETPRDYRLTLRTKDLQPLFNFMASNLIVAPSTALDLTVKGRQQLEGEISSHFIGIGTNYIRDISAIFNNSGGPISLSANADLIKVAGMRFYRDSADITLYDNGADLNFSFDNSGENGEWASISAKALFPEKGPDSYIAEIGIANSTIALDPVQKWTISPSTIRYRPRNIDVDRFRISNGEQYLGADGTISENASDTLRIKMERLDLGMANGLANLPFALSGHLTGDVAGFALLDKEMGLLANIRGEKIGIDENPVGEIDIACNWDKTQKRFVLRADNTLDGRTPMKIRGSFKPSPADLGAEIILDSLSTPFLNGLAKGIVSNMGEGSISGKINLAGNPDKLDISSQGLRLNQFACTVDYTKVPYVLDGPFELNNNGIRLGRVRMSDEYGNTGRARGGVSFDRFKDIRLDLNFETNKMLALNTTPADNEVFYGKSFATGVVRISGPLDKIFIDITLKPDAGSNLHVALGGSQDEASSILSFVSPSDTVTVVEVDPYSMYLSREAEKGKSASTLKVRVRATATPDIEINLDVNTARGDMIKAYGNGEVDINVEPKQFDIKGKYSIDRGSYHLSLMGITAKDFIVNSGSSLQFNGDVMNTDLDITAIYRTKASISTLLADSTSTTRRSVECGIGIKGKLSNPQLGFDINIPDLDPTTQGRVDAVFNTEEKRLKQILALLVSGSFVPDEQSGIVNNTTLLYSNASEIMANQVNNIFRELEIPLDLGFNYQPTDNGVDIFDVAISTQLFNNLITINGNIGNQNYLGSSTSELVGNVDVEVKLNRSGNLRFNVFSHAADRYSNFLDQTQRNGIGIVYQQEFDTVKELWNRIIGKHTEPEYPFGEGRRSRGRMREGTGIFPLRDSGSFRPGFPGADSLGREMPGRRGMQRDSVSRSVPNL